MRQVTAAVIVEHGRLLLTRRPPGDHLAGLWELPGGKVEPGETPQECLARELVEELAMTSDVGELLASVTYHYAHGSFELLAYRVTRMSDYELHVHDESVWVRLGEVAGFSLAPADVLLIEQLQSADSLL